MAALYQCQVSSVTIRSGIPVSKHGPRSSFYQRVDRWVCTARATPWRPDTVISTALYIQYPLAQFWTSKQTAVMTRHPRSVSVPSIPLFSTTVSWDPLHSNKLEDLANRNSRSRGTKWRIHLLLPKGNWNWTLFPFMIAYKTTQVRPFPKTRLTCVPSELTQNLSPHQF